MLRWEESGGPPLGSPGPAGFGTRLLHRVIVEELGGEVAVEHVTAGLRCRLWLPASPHVRP
jgi:hypothetical protein